MAIDWKKMQLTISSSKTDLCQKVKLDKDNVCIFFQNMLHIVLHILKYL